MSLFAAPLHSASHPANTRQVILTDIKLAPWVPFSYTWISLGLEPRLEEIGLCDTAGCRATLRLNRRNPRRREGALCASQPLPHPTHPPVSGLGESALNSPLLKALGLEAGLPASPICRLMFNPTSLHIIHTRETRVGVGSLPNHHLPGIPAFHLSPNSSRAPTLCPFTQCVLSCNRSRSPTMGPFS